MPAAFVLLGSLSSIITGCAPAPDMAPQPITPEPAVDRGDLLPDDSQVMQGRGEEADTEESAEPIEVNEADTEVPVEVTPLDEGVSDSEEAPEPVETVTEPEPVEPSSVYTDGSYSSNGAYSTPGGPEEVAVTLTVENDVITSVVIGNIAKHEISKKWTNSFRDGIAGEVVGVNLSELDAVGATNGSSLTPIGFNTALSSIKVQATR